MNQKMKRLFLIIFSLLLIFNFARGFNFEELDLVSEESLSKLYEKWMGHYSIVRGTDEMDRRLEIFKDNVKYVHDTMTVPYNLKLNNFADLTFEEFFDMYGNCYTCDGEETYENVSGRFMHENTVEVELPTSVDWRREGAVTGAKSQGKYCRSCWAFSVVAAVEGINKIINKKELVSLSEQELVDCDSNNDGCKPGDIKTAFEFIKRKDGITTEKNYPYKDRFDGCSATKKDNVMIDDYKRVTEDNEAALAAAVAIQPVSVVIAMDDRRFVQNTGEVYKGPCGTETNHAMTVVGYGIEDGTKFWIVKNSYGKDWGDEGYIRIEKDIDNPQGRCGIAMNPWYPIMNSPLHPSAPEDKGSKNDEL